MYLKMEVFFVVVMLTFVNALPDSVGTGSPNFILILADDQDVVLNGMVPLRNTQKLLANAGITFTNAFTSSPICCPSRASILCGQYPHNHQTKNNSVTGGCYAYHWRDKVEPQALPVLLHNEGYETFFAGKYLNEYSGEIVPPGWDHWYGLNGNSKYYNYTLTENGIKKHYENDYLTDKLRRYSLDFLSNKRKSAPFFLMVAPPAAHAPYIPADRHQNEFEDLNLLETPNFNVASGELDKHWLLRMSPPTLPQSAIDILREIYRKRWQTLLAVDELVAELIVTLETLNLLDNTYIIYTSDNGFHMGQFALGADKRQPYDTDIRVPFMVRGPNIKPKSISNAPVLLIDIVPTILDLAVIQKPANLDGISFKDQLNINERSDGDNFQRQLLIEYWGEGNMDSYNPECGWNSSDMLYGCSAELSCHCEDSRNNTYACLRYLSTQDDYLFCEFNDKEGFVEMFDLHNDPYQMDNLAFDMLPSERTMYSFALSKLEICGGDTCRHIY